MDRRRVDGEAAGPRREGAEGAVGDGNASEEEKGGEGRGKGSHYLRMSFSGDGRRVLAGGRSGDHRRRGGGGGGR